MRKEEGDPLIGMNDPHQGITDHLVIDLCLALHLIDILMSVAMVVREVMNETKGIDIMSVRGDTREEDLGSAEQTVAMAIEEGRQWMTEAVC